MDMDLAGSVLAARGAATQQAVAIAIIKQNHEMQQALIQMVDEVARSAPPPGQGRVVDKLA
jgi:hypothetical protein